MGFFPRAWVFPGGHLEVDEGLEEGALREFYEEVGVEVKTRWDSESGCKKYSYGGQEIEVTPIFAFESTTPSDLRDASNPRPPRVSHLVVFFKLQLPVKCTDVDLVFQVSEVEATAWLDLVQIKQILERNESIKDDKIEHSIDLLDNGQFAKGNVPMASLFPFYPNERKEGLVGAARLLIQDFLAEANAE